MKKEEIIEIIFNCLEELNQQNGIESSIDLNSKLFGPDSHLDSLGLVNLIVNIEEIINTRFNVSISIVDEKAMSQKHSPFRSVDSLATYILELINK